MSQLLPTPREEPLEYSEEVQDEPQTPSKSLFKMATSRKTEVSGPPSPPSSPAKGRVVGESSDEPYRDPLLYSDTQHGSYSPSTPLFPQESLEEAIEQHIETNRRDSGDSTLTFRTGVDKDEATTMPTVDEYKLTTLFVSILHRQDPHQLFKETMAENEINYHNVPVNGLKKKKHSRAPLQPVAISKPPRTLKHSALFPKKYKQATNRVLKATPHRHFESFARAETPVSTKVTMIKKSMDRDFEKLEDFTPPVETLGNRSDAFTFTKWTGKPLDLSSDPYRHLLHPSELRAAEALRLECDRWLVTKRMIFKGAVECYKSGKDFKKTDAQKATVIDVNKASKIWEAFNSVGWFDAKYLAHHVISL